MKIPDCYEGYRQEEERQRKWDETLSKCPECRLCGRRIRPDLPYHFTGTTAVCAECFDDLAENEGIVEVD
jgi:hypothetical protein